MFGQSISGNVDMDGNGYPGNRPATAGDQWVLKTRDDVLLTTFLGHSGRLCALLRISRCKERR